MLFYSFKTVYMLTAGDLRPWWTACCWIDRVTSARRHISRAGLAASRRDSGNLPLIDGGRQARSELPCRVTPETGPRIPQHARASGADPPIPFDAWWVPPCRRSRWGGQVNAAGKLRTRLRRIYLGKVSTGLRGVSVNNCCRFIFAAYAQVALEITDGCRRLCTAWNVVRRRVSNTGGFGPWKVKACSRMRSHLSADSWVHDGVEDNKPVWTRPLAIFLAKVSHYDRLELAS